MSNQHTITREFLVSLKEFVSAPSAEGKSLLEKFSATKTTQDYNHLKVAFIKAMKLSHMNAINCTQCPSKVLKPKYYLDGNLVCSTCWRKSPKGKAERRLAAKETRKKATLCPVCQQHRISHVRYARGARICTFCQDRAFESPK